MNFFFKLFYFSFVFFSLFNQSNAYPQTITTNQDGTVPFTVALKQRNTDILLDALQTVSDPLSNEYGNFWSRDEISALLSPPLEEIYPVLGWISKNQVNYTYLGDAIDCKATISGLENLFGVSYKEIRPGVFVLLSPKFNIPFDIIDFVSGLSTDAIPQPPRRKCVGGSDGYIGGEVIKKLYNIPDIDIVNVSAAAFEYGGGGFSQDDLETQQKLNGEPVKKVKYVIGDNTGDDIESQLDMQMISQTAQGVDEWYWNNQGWLYSQAVRFFNSTNIPQVGSISYGWAENDQCSIMSGCVGNETSEQYVKRVNIEYAKIGLRGTTLLVSSGDAGSPSRSNEGCLPTAPNIMPEFPASSPHVLSVGGTRIIPLTSTTPAWKTPLCKQYGCNSGTIETVSNFADIGWTSGGAFSLYSQRPAYQNDAIDNYLTSGVYLPPNFNKAGRGVPDVTAVSHEAAVIDQGSIMAVDGTSMSSPIMAGIITIINQHRLNKGKSTLGFVNPLLYKAYSDDPTIFNDYTKGNTSATEMQECSKEYGFKAAKGWDPVYGLGSINVGKLIDYLDKL